LQYFEISGRCAAIVESLFKYGISLLVVIPFSFSCHFKMSGQFNAGEFAQKVVVTLDNLLQHAIHNVPNIEKLLLDILDAMFYPKQIGRQVMMIAALQFVLLSYSSINSGWTALMQSLTNTGLKEKKLTSQLKEVLTYDEWQVAARKLDSFRGFDHWRSSDYSIFYDTQLIQKRILLTRDMLRRGDVFDLMFRLRSGLARDQFGMQHEGLFSRALAGTKHIVEKYLDTMCEGLNFICDTPIAEEEVSFV
jgi:TAG lipase / steryl ester hydrolase / phospholipase A2 / LPA acyltransferase